MNVNWVLQETTLNRPGVSSENIINTKYRTVEHTVKKLIQNDVVREDSEDMANMFNDYIVDTGKNIAESIGDNRLDYIAYNLLTNLILFSSDQFIVIPLKK